MKKATLICDLQFGSTGKGLLAGYLAKRNNPDVIVSAWSPNAGHTFIDNQGNKFVSCMIPNGVVADSVKTILLGPGSLIDFDLFWKEHYQYMKFMQRTYERSGTRYYHKKILIHPHAGIVAQRHRDEEAGPMTKIGSTKKGCGAALIEKIRRNPDSVIVAKDFLKGTVENVRVATIEEYNSAVDEAKSILIEGAQGFSLGINSGFYPYTTFRECSPVQILSDCAVPMAYLQKTIGTMRTYPIRVANRYDEQGNQIGWSGPCYDDQKEISWEDMNVPAEFTTVTKLKRRVFTFSEQQTIEAVRYCRPDEIFLNFANYCKDGELGHIMGTIRQVCSAYGGQLRYLGMGATEDDIIDMGVSEGVEQCSEVTSL